MWLFNNKYKKEAQKLRSFIAETLPFLEEAWEACFQGQEEKLLSAEERGMGLLLSQFRNIADGKPAIPVSLITRKEAYEQTNTAIKWATDLFGHPNDLKEPYKQYILPGDTCADGLKKAHKIIQDLQHSK